MYKNELKDIKKKLLALSLASLLLVTTGCTSKKTKIDEPIRINISSKYSNVEDFYKYVIKNGEAVKLYNSQYVYLLYNKETYDVTKYIYKSPVTILGGAELYNLESEELLVYSDGINTCYNKDYFQYLIDNNYQVCLKDVSDYVEGAKTKEYYSLDEIKELEVQVAESLKIINKAKTMVK